MASFLKEIGNFLLGEGINKLKEKVDKTIKDVEQRIERATIKVIKTLTLFVMMLIGALFVLVGLAQYLNETVPGLRHGLGTVLIGAVLILLALFVRLMK
jgi:cell division protein ZapA (FtsZ GTPase activity inhibitor)